MRMNSLKTTIVFLFAHPDDESMFFLPTIFGVINEHQQQQQQQQLQPQHARERKDNHQSSDISSTSPTTTTSTTHSTIILFLCLSNGNYHGLGNVRTQELNRLVEYLRKQIQPSQQQQRQSTSFLTFHVQVVNHPQLQDSPHQRWCFKMIATVLRQALRPFTLDGDPNEDVDSNLVKVYTFDHLGISGHVNHVDTYYGLCHFMRTLKPHHVSKFRTYQLMTVSHVDIFAKYFPIYHWMILLCHLFRIKPFWNSSKTSNDHIYYLHQPWINWKCMSIHASQFVWYRRLFVLFSCYTYENRWQPLHGKNIECPMTQQDD
jgi:N-acetylglucosaminylphosphatidylinositol deacetylase